MTNPPIWKSLTEPRNRTKIWITLAIAWSFIVLGWTFGQYGPSILELQIITNVSLQYASGFMIGHSIGYLFGSLLSGIFFDKISGDKSVSLLISALGFAATLAIIPWCYIYETMVIAHVLKGFFGAGIDTCGNALLAHEWAHDNRIFQFLMQLLHFIFGLAGIASPFAISPFLTDLSISTSSNKENVGILSTAVSTVGYLDSSNRSIAFTVKLVEELSTISSNSNVRNTTASQTIGKSLLYIPFSVTSSLSLMSALFFLLLIILNRKKQETRKEKKSHQDSTKKLTNSSREFLILILLMVIFGTYIAVEDGFDAYLPSFCVRHMNWPPTDASAATSLYWASFSTGRIVGIIGANVFKPRYQLIVHFIFLVMGYVCFLLSGFFQTDAGIWTSIVITGLGTSVIFPTLYTFVNQELFPLSGRITSMLITAAAIGTLVNPILLSYLMENISTLALSYVLLPESCISLITIILILKLSRKSILSQEKTNEIVIPTGMNTANGKINPAFESTQL